jgi:hypothetical protein
MTDEEWKRWASTYAQEQRPMPPVLARARTVRARAILAFTLAYALAAGLTLISLHELPRAETWPERASSLFVPLFVLLMILGMHVTMRGTFARAAGAPLELLADLERRHAGRRRLIRLLPWMTGVGVGATIALEAAQMRAAGRFDPSGVASTLAVCAATVAFVRWVTRRVGKVIERELRAAAEARWLLQDLEDGEAS